MIIKNAPAEGAVAVLRLFARADDHGDVPLNTSGHSFLTITNVSAQDINVGGLLIAPDTSITVSTRGNRCEHSGIWYNLEGYYKYYLNASYYQNLYGIQVSLDQSQLDTVNQALANADHWSAIYNCTSFSAGLWNAVCSDTLSAGVPETPADLKADMLRKYPDKTVLSCRNCSLSLLEAAEADAAKADTTHSITMQSIIFRTLFLRIFKTPR